MRHGVPTNPSGGSVLALVGALVAVQARMPELLQHVGSFGRSMVRESSGVAVSRKHPGVLWTHNDSGDGPFLYAARLDGTILGRHDIVGAAAVDWEDIDLASCPTIPGDCLYIADTGDNEGRRRSVTIYIVPEPDTVEGRSGGRARQALSAWALRVTYPDGPRDVEALWVDPDGRVELVSKGQAGAIRRYRVPREALLQDSVTAQAAGVLPISPQQALGRWVTGAAMAPHTRQVAIRTYTEIFFFRVGENDTLEPDGPPCWLGTREAQGEGVAYLDDETLVLTSEAMGGQEGLIHRVRC